MTDLEAAIAALVTHERARDALQALVSQLADRERLSLAELVQRVREEHKRQNLERGGE